MKSNEKVVTIIAIIASGLIGAMMCSIFIMQDEIETKELEDKIEFLTEAFTMNHINESDPDWECKKWVGIVELAKQDYPNFVEETLLMAEKKCDFDVNDITS